MDELWIDAFPALKALEDPARLALQQAVRPLVIPKGTVIFREGDRCENYVLVVAGSIRVQMISETGREIVLYRVETGETCVLTTTCLMTQGAYAAQGIAETDVKAVGLPSRAYREMLATSRVFRDFVFQAFGNRISELLLLIEEVAFGRIDMRLAQLLLDRRDPENRLPLTHQQLAVELGTAREVVSRQLKDFERRGWVGLHRGFVEVLNLPELRTLAG